MARKSQGWSLHLDPRNGVYTVRFRAKGRRVHRSTGETDRSTAQTIAARIYEEELIYDRRIVAKTRAPLEDLLGEWLAAMEAEKSKRTIELYINYARAQWLPYFKKISNITNVELVNYMRARLKSVMNTTVQRELTGLKSFVKYIYEQGYLRERLTVPNVPRGALGTRKGTNRRIDLSPSQVDQLLKAMPERTVKGHPARAYFTVAWETGLRPSTLNALRLDVHYKRGANTLLISSDIDKNTYAREIPISDAARDALDSAIAQSHERGDLIFGQVNYRKALLKAALQIGLPIEDAKHVSRYDFKHGAITHMTSVTGNLPGIGFLVGIKKISTLSRYAHPQRKLAEEVLNHLNRDTKRDTAKLKSKEG